MLFITNNFVTIHTFITFHNQGHVLTWKYTRDWWVNLSRRTVPCIFEVLKKCSMGLKNNGIAIFQLKDYCFFINGLLSNCDSTRLYYHFIYSNATVALFPIRTVRIRKLYLSWEQGSPTTTNKCFDNRERKEPGLAALGYLRLSILLWQKLNSEARGLKIVNVSAVLSYHSFMYFVVRTSPDDFH